ncbi:hypothetical protein KXQ82_01995 [Mucilaginibacter sp. HMF5004]|uniref:hypothetical protein n=1 Tax=Mucilaginibacter rivuli TaxID=2857527 RepID=UPI001C5EDB25|nr:hypothetical protein [Mucilaginibacter rivuli]MBW4888462.1 hypothetical protein [Mucilaginibacter rivuli]
MKIISLTDEQHTHLKNLHNELLTSNSLTIADRECIIDLISPFLTSDNVIFTNNVPELPPQQDYTINEHIKMLLSDWKKLLLSLPGFDFCPTCYIVNDDAKEFLEKNIVMISEFSPTMSFNMKRDSGFELRLKNDGTGDFWFPTFEDAKQYPELYNFKGSWKEAYDLLIETLKKGWPMEEFPEELLPLLKK